MLRFFYKFCQISTLLLHLVNSSHIGALCSASAWQTRGRGFEPMLMPYILAENIPVLSGRRVPKYTVMYRLYHVCHVRNARNQG